MGRDSSTSLAPGFRFHPTDEELVRYYLKRKISGKSFRFDPISVIDIYKSEPWDLPGKSKLKTRDLEWYFFSALDRKYGNSSRTNRATEKGYWKTTGKDRPVHHNSRMVGMKKTLVYHCGRAPRGARTNWVMHEYRLTDEELEKAGIAQNAFVLCRIFQKSGTGPKNGEKYGAPFIEEEWDDDEELTLVPGPEAVADEMPGGYDASVEGDDFHQNLDEGIQSENTALPSTFFYGDTSNYAEQSNEFIDNDQKPILGMGETAELRESMKFFSLPEQHGLDAEPVTNDYFCESSNSMNLGDINYLLDEPYLNDQDNLDEPYLAASDNLQQPYFNASNNVEEPYMDGPDHTPTLSDGLFLETNDLSNPVEANPTGFDLLEEYLTFFDTDGDNFDMSFDPSDIMGSEDPISNQATLEEKKVDEAIEHESMARKDLSDDYGSKAAASSPKQEAETSNSESDTKNPFIKQVSDMLGNIPAPPAFASEFPSKATALRLNSATQPSSSVHVTAGMIQIRNMTLNSNPVDPIFSKTGNVSLVLSFTLPRADIISSFPSMDSPHKMGLMGGGFLFFFILLWVLILSVSFKVGSCICAR